MRIFVTGGTGFIGRALVEALVNAGHDPLVLVRSGETRTKVPGAEYVTEDSTGADAFKRVAECDGAVNLAGEPVKGRWNRVKKKAIRDSRVVTTRNLVDAIPAGCPFTLISTSAQGIYGDAGERDCVESSPLGRDFLATVAREWEEEAKRAEAKGARVVIARFAVVLGSDGGALPELERLTLNHLGGPIGGGNSWFSWIHRDDLTAALLFLLTNPELSGTFNVSSPNPVRQGDFAHLLGKVLHRKASLHTPGIAVRLAMGEEADLVLFSQKTLPGRLTEAGFIWSHPFAEEALDTLLRAPDC